MDGRSGRQARPMDSLSALWVGRDKSPTVCAIGQMRVWSLAPTGKPYKRVLRAKPRESWFEAGLLEPRSVRGHVAWIDVTRLRAQDALLQGFGALQGMRVGEPRLEWPERQVVRMGGPTCTGALTESVAP